MNNIKIYTIIILLPLTYTILFFGYLKPEFNAVFQLQNVKGEAELSTYISGPSSIGMYYEASCEFNELTEDLHIIGYHYDVENISLTLTGVEAMDFVSCDLDIMGIPIGHYTAAEMLSTGTITDNMTVSSDGNYVHFSFSDPDEIHTITFEGVRLIPVWFWIGYALLILLVNALVSLGVIYVINYYEIKNIYPLATVSYTLFTILMGMLINDSFPYATYSFIFFNWLLLFAAGMLFNGIVRPYWGTVFTSSIVFIWYNVNYFVIQFRGKPIMPSDLRAFDTAFQVIDGYRVTPTPKMFVIIIIWYAVTTWYRKSHRKYLAENTDTKDVKRNIQKRGFMLAIAVLIFVFCVNNPIYANLESFAWDVMLLENFHREGMLLTYVKSYLNARVKKPEGYSAEIVNKCLEDYLAKETPVTNGIQPKRIIMIMNEAFSDLRVSGLDPAVDVMPYIDSLKENTMSGTLYVSVYGGGTCNTEFEALTGNSMSFFPMGIYPYVETIDKDVFSLASYFSDKSYYTASFHPNEAVNWNRNLVYPMLGFSDFYSINDYDKVDYLREKVTDDSNYRFIEKISRDNGGQQFLFNVTMQNHSDYDNFNDLNEAREVNDIDATELKVYLSLIKESDKAVEKLIEKYRNDSEPTMIVFFGDHEPGLYADAAKEVYGENMDALRRYQTDYFIWTNYDTEGEEEVAVSANYLPYVILKRANLPLPPYVMMLEELYKKYPVITSQGVVDKDGNYYTGVDQLISDPLITKYRYIQYANLFDDIDKRWFATE